MNMTFNNDESDDEDWATSYRKKQKLRSTKTATSMVDKIKASTQKISLNNSNNSKANSTKIATMIEDINNDESTRQLTSANINNKNVQTVTFDVGGKHYTVSRSLLESFPNTKLAKDASNVWTNNNGNQIIEPIFIERDGDRFQWIIDYMRDGMVSLPCSISKEALMNDMKSLGFDIDPQNIRFDIHIPDFADHNIYWKTKHKQIVDKLNDIEYKLENRISNNANNIIEVNAIRMKQITKANDLRDKYVNKANRIADFKIKNVKEKNRRQLQAKNFIKLKHKYTNLAYKCLDHYMNTKELEWQQCMNQSEFENYGSYVSHKDISEFMCEFLPIKDDIIMKGIANEFGLSHIYVYSQTIATSVQSDDVEIKDNNDSDNVEYHCRVKYGILSK